MAATIFELRKRSYVCGLFWQSLSQPRELKAETLELARKLNFDLFVLRKDLGVAQAGFASTREGAHSGMLSLGALVASTVAAKGVQQGERRQPAASWLAALRIDDDRWAYFAVRDESFLPAGDFAGSRSEVLDRLYADYGLGGWNAVIGDPELADQGLHHFNPATLDDFLPAATGRRPWLASAWELVPVERSRRRLIVAGAAVAGVATVVGAGLWWRQQAVAEAEAREQAMLSAQQRLQAEQAKMTPPPPWLGQPAPLDFAQACGSQMTRLSPGGWRLDEYACAGRQRTYTWSRGDSNVAYLIEHVPGARVELGGERARYTEPLSAPAAPAETLLQADTVLNALTSRFQHLGVRLAIKAPTAPPQQPVLPGVRQSAPPPPAWQSYPFSLKAGGLPLADVASALSQPGVRMTNLAFRQGEWFIEGVAYAK